MDVLRREFKLSKFGFGGICFQRFYYCMWKLPPIVVILYKLSLLAYSVSMLIWTSIRAHPHKHASYAAYLTHWTFLLLCLYLLVSTVIVVTFHLHRLYRRKSQQSACSYLFKSPDGWYETIFSDSDDCVTQINGVSTEEQESLVESNTSSQFEAQTRIASAPTTPWFISLCWILHSTACVAVLFVTLMYFSSLYKKLHPHGGISMYDLQQHGMTSVVLFIDFILNPIPIRLLHVIYPLIYCTIYLLFSIFYWVDDHDHVMYPVILDWNHPTTTVLINLAALLMLLFIHILFFAGYRLKMFIWSKLRS